ncbi:MAG: ferritin-like protein [Thermoleophilia bacterium]|nr:ferritin-like protein [Thermoleophilia bacterium]
MTDTTLTLDELDPSSAIVESMEAAHGTTRGDFLKRAAVGASGMTIAASLIGPSGALGAASTGSPKQDIEVLNYALTLEFLEAAFYLGATRSKKLNTANARFAKVVYAHEAAHVKAIRDTIVALGGTPVKSPKFNFKGTNLTNTVFQKTALALEETGIKAYAGQVGRLDNPAVLAAAASIHSVETRHAAWMRVMLGLNPAPAAFDKPYTMAQTLRVVGSTGFIVG